MNHYINQYKKPKSWMQACIIHLMLSLNIIFISNTVLAIESQAEQIEIDSKNKDSPVNADIKQENIEKDKNRKKHNRIKKTLKVNICLDIIPELNTNSTKSSFFSFLKKDRSAKGSPIKNPKNYQDSVSKENDITTQESSFSSATGSFESNAFKTRITTDLEITPTELKEIKEALLSIKEHAEKSSQEFSNAGQIAYWDNEISSSIKDLMKSKGYYACIVKTEADIDTEKKIYTLSFYIYSRDRYKLGDIELLHDKGSNNKIALPDIKSLKSQTGHYAVAEDIIQDQKYILSKIEDENCLLYLTIQHGAVINHRNHTISIRYLVNAGPEAEIRNVAYEGLESLNEEYLRKLVSLKGGTCFKRSKLIEARRILQTSGLFYSTKIDVEEDPESKVNEIKKVPIILRLKEKKKRSVKLGLSYGTDLGFGINLGWENRNIFSNAEELKLNSFINQKEQFGSLEFIKPFFLQDNQKLKAAISGGNTSHRAFDSKDARLFLGLERKYFNYLDVGIGGKFTFSRIKEPNNPEEDFLLISAPVLVQYDRRDNVLNSRKGYLLKANLEPFKDLDRKQSIFLKNTIGARYYLPFARNDNGESVIATKILIGSIVGNKNANIPPNERFYAGGSTSIRGYGFQLAGPVIDGTKIPSGGKSMVEASLEYRYAHSNNLGLAFFLDSGTVYKNTTPKLKDKLFYGVGVGLRYNTDFGPIRADIAFPTKRRKKIDDAYQLYFGIGQSF